MSDPPPRVTLRPYAEVAAGGAAVKRSGAAGRGPPLQWARMDHAAALMAAAGLWTAATLRVLGSRTSDRCLCRAAAKIAAFLGHCRGEALVPGLAALARGDVYLPGQADQRLQGGPGFFGL